MGREGASCVARLHATALLRPWGAIWLRDYLGALFPKRPVFSRSSAQSPPAMPLLNSAIILWKQGEEWCRIQDSNP